MSYTAPPPTEDQVANAMLKGYDPNDLAGSLPYWDCSPSDVLAAAAVIHDELTLRGGPLEYALVVAANFERDCKILAGACDGFVRQELELAKALLFVNIVNLTIETYWRTEDLNTDITRAQGEAQMRGAQRWINACAQKIGTPTPYPEAT